MFLKKAKKGASFSARNMQQTYTNRKIYKFRTTFGRGTDVDTQQKKRISTRFMTTSIGKLKSVLFTIWPIETYIMFLYLTWLPVTRCVKWLDRHFQIENSYGRRNMQF